MKSVQEFILLSQHATAFHLLLLTEEYSLLSPALSPAPPHVPHRRRGGVLPGGGGGGAGQAFHKPHWEGRSLPKRCGIHTCIITRKSTNCTFYEECNNLQIVDRVRVQNVRKNIKCTLSGNFWKSTIVHLGRVPIIHLGRVNMEFLFLEEDSITSIRKWNGPFMW